MSDFSCLADPVVLLAWYVEKRNALAGLVGMNLTSGSVAMRIECLGDVELPRMLQVFDSDESLMHIWMCVNHLLARDASFQAFEEFALGLSNVGGVVAKISQSP